MLGEPCCGGDLDEYLSSRPCASCGRGDVRRSSRRGDEPSLLRSRGDTLLLRGEALRSDGFQGHMALVVDILRTRPDGSGEEWVSNYETVEFRKARGGDGWESAQRTRDFPKSTLQIRVAAVGTFRGEVKLRGLRLEHAP